MLSGRFEMSLVLVSIAVAILASYTALSMAGRVSTSRGSAARWWIAGGGFAMGTGIWSMHFIGMLAFRLPIPLGYDLPITLLSLLLPIAVSAMALWQVSRPELRPKRLIAGALLMGLGINAMHYTGMAAMRMDPGIHYDPLLFAASVAIAISAAGVSLWIAYKLRRNKPFVLVSRAAAAVVMGVAIAGMHYTGMAAASFPIGSVCRAASNGVGLDELAVVVTVATLGVLGTALLLALYDARTKARTEIFNILQTTAEERRILLDRERTARAEAERMSELKDEFLATLSHELRTPLNAVLGWAQMLRLGIQDEATLHKGLDTIERNARAQAQLIDDLLDMSRIISGKIRLDVQLADPASFIQTAMETVGPAAKAKGILLEKRIDPDTGMIFGDPDRLQQVMWNLLSNAVKFTPNGGNVLVSARRAGRDIVIKVTDDGIGIESEFLLHVFDRFRQADASTTRRYGGLGLGLSIVKHLVEVQGGTIAAESRGRDRGATFTIHFPLAESLREVSGEQQEHRMPLQPSAAWFAPEDLSDIEVLVVDDEPDARDVVAQMLAACNARVLTAANAEQGLAMLAEKSPDVLVSDIGMPDIDGFEFLRRVRLRSAQEGGTLPAIALTAFTRPEDRQQAKLAGFSLYLTKPVEPSALIAGVSALGRRQTRSEAH
jgi:NO-binding membrane sensor protein with MHYT domain/CheY-like chemotaxis protein/two-component sensor histidine kinase